MKNKLIEIFGHCFRKEKFEVIKSRNSRTDGYYTTNNSRVYTTHKVND